MSEPTLPTIAAVLEDLKKTGTGEKKLKQFVDWHGENQDSDSQALLVFAEGLYQDGGLPDGTLLKMGRKIKGDSYAIPRHGESSNDEVLRLRKETAEQAREITALRAEVHTLRGKLRAQYEEAQANRFSHEFQTQQPQTRRGRARREAEVEETAEATS